MATWKPMIGALAICIASASGLNAADNTFKFEWQTCAAVDGFVPPAVAEGSVCFVVDAFTLNKKFVVKIAGGLGVKGEAMVFGVKARTMMVVTGEFPVGTTKEEAIKQLQLELTNKLQQEKFKEEARAAANFEAKIKSFSKTTIQDDPKTREELKKLLEANASRK